MYIVYVFYIYILHDKLQNNLGIIWNTYVPISIFSIKTGRGGLPENDYIFSPEGKYSSKFAPDKNDLFSYDRRNTELKYPVWWK